LIYASAWTWLAVDAAWQNLIRPILKITISSGQDLLTPTKPWFPNSAMTFKSGRETLWQVSDAEEFREVTAASLEASGSCLERSHFAPKEWEVLRARVCFLVFRVPLTPQLLLSSPFYILCLFWGFCGIRDLAGMGDGHAFQAFPTQPLVLG